MLLCTSKITDRKIFKTENRIRWSIRLSTNERENTELNWDMRHKSILYFLIPKIDLSLRVN